MSEINQAELKDLGEVIAQQVAGRDYAGALAVIEQIPLSARTPLVLSAYALCTAAAQGSYKSSVNLCHEAIKKDPKNPEHYYRQGRILLLAGKRKDAIWVLRMGLRHGRHKEILETLAALGLRRTPPISFLARSNPLNKYLGMLLARLNLR
jgi:thioredoxin-like negative regulator of GroEL